MKQLLVLALLFINLLACSLVVGAQKLKLSTAIGDVTGTLPYLKKQMKYGEISIGIEKDHNKRIFSEFSAGVSTLRYDYYDSLVNSVYVTRTYFNTIATINQRQIFKRSGNSLYMGLGLVCNYSISNKTAKRSFTSHGSSRKNLGGFHISPVLVSGIDCPLNKRTSIGIAASVQLNAYSRYKELNEKLKLDKFLLSFHYKRHLKKQYVSPFFMDDALAIAMAIQQPAL